uniref:Uncharacterized protein n=1 Tax=Anguilla anguilla TaxID=7936 RepID=A0A0E9WN96_ANGAN
MSHLKSLKCNFEAGYADLNCFLNVFFFTVSLVL